MSRPELLIVKGLMPQLMKDLSALYTLHELHKSDDPKALLQSLAPTLDVLVTSAWGPVRDDLMAKLPHLKLIASFGVGLDHIDLEAARRRGIKVAHTPGVLNDAVADTALALILACHRRICEADRFVREGRWAQGTFPLGRDLRGQKLGVVGMGRIGRAIAHRAEAFGMKILYHGPRTKTDVAYPYFASLIELAQAADILVLALPGDAQNAKIVNGEVLKALGPQGTLINIARGSVVDEKALIQALKSGDLGAAGLDVVENEPHADPELLSCPNLVLLPHIGSGTVETRTAMKDLVLANVQAYFAGEGLPSPAF